MTNWVSTINHSEIAGLKLTIHAFRASVDITTCMSIEDIHQAMLGLNIYKLSLFIEGRNY